MPLYIADYLSATEHLDAAHSGAYLHLIMHYWQKGNLPQEDRFLARIARMTDRQWAVARPTLQKFFVDGWRHNRIESELAHAQLKAEARASAGSRGGLSKSLKHKQLLVAKATDLLQQTPSKQPSESLPSSSGLEELSNDSSKKLVMLTHDSSTKPLSAPCVDPPAEKIERPKEQTAEVRETLRFAGEQWNLLAANIRLPLIDEIKSGSQRERYLLARIRELERDFGDARAGIADLLARIRGSPYLRGEVNGFRCTFDWIINASNFQKIREGNYEDRKEQPRRRFGSR